MSDLRRATRDDNTALLDLFGAVPMQGDLVLSSQRAPDSFRLYAVTPASRPRDTFPPGRTGFEVCLP